MTTVLVIEDEDFLRENIMTMLKFEGFKTLDAPDGQTGVERARASIPDLIICDIMMPGMDGYEVLQALRDDPATATIPIIFLTARASRSHVRLGMSLGADDYVSKPFSHEELIAAVRTRLERQQALEREYRQQIEELQLAIVTALPPTLQAPLNQVMDNADRLITNAGALSPAEVETSAETMLQASEYLHRQIENYLLFAQIEIIRFDPARVVAIYNSHLPQAHRLITRVAQSEATHYDRAADLALDVAPATIQVSRESMHKIIQELVSNALKYSPPGSPVDVHGCVEGDRYVLQVTDQGEGIPPDVIARVMDPPRLRASLSSHEELPGLGLVVVRYLVDVHGGEFQLNGEAGQGTSACVTLPVSA